ncbi:hypothetical protein K502DRAFT_342046 [Neoconidiobolus thromboides FSU 785]|nr:hypothetical protein K502DRAFT_342046 [Neoconidiobolus thromboides FSU 785]
MLGQEKTVIDLKKYQHTTSEDLATAIKKEHDMIKYLYSLFQEATTNKNKEEISNEIIRQISVHSVAEEIVVYPFVKDKLGDDQYSKSLNEHRHVKEDLYSLSAHYMRSDSEEFSSKLNKVFEEFKKHSDEEEEFVLPQITKVLSEGENKKLVEDFIKKREEVPTRPHPSAPDTQPSEDIVGKMQAPVDKASDRTFRSFPESTS